VAEGVVEVLDVEEEAEVVVASVEEVEVEEEEEVSEGAPEEVAEDLEVVEDDHKQRILAGLVLRLFNLSSVQNPSKTSRSKWHSLLHQL